MLSQFDYSYDPVGNPTRVDKTGGAVETYGYDNRDRLTSVCYQASCPNGSDPQIGWSYDPVGNRLTETRPAGTTTYSYDAGDQLTQASGPSGTTSYGYDGRGNETQDGSRTFGYDLADRVTSTSDSGTTTTYGYDGDGNRLTAADGTSTTRYLWDANNTLPQLALERDGAGNVLRSYVYGLDTISMNEAGAAYYFHYDALGSVVNLTSASGQTEWSYSYEPYGDPRSTTQNDPAAPANLLRFTGEYLDPTGLYNLRARLYDPTDGRFLQQDPVPASADAAYAGAYAYTAGRPTALADPSGAVSVPPLPKSSPTLWWQFSEGFPLSSANLAPFNSGWVRRGGAVCCIIITLGGELGGTIGVAEPPVHVPDPPIAGPVNPGTKKPGAGPDPGAGEGGDGKSGNGDKRGDGKKKTVRPKRRR